MNQIKPYRKLKGALLASFLIFSFIGISSANYLAEWPDDALCQWMANPSPPEHIVNEVERRGIGCDGGKAVAASNNNSKNTPQANSETKTASKSNTSGKDSKIKIYDVEFTPGILDELLNLVISKTEYDFSAHRLSSNKDNYKCGFSLKRIVYENDPNGNVENWNMLTGNAHINGSDVSLSGSWRMGGLSNDPSYLEDEVNLKLTQDGHLVGKMAYFLLTVSDGEVPRNPLYVVLNEHQRSTPIKLSNINRNETFDQYIDVEDWAGGFMQVYACRKV